MQIFELDGLLFMIMDTEDDFTFERKAAMDEANPRGAGMGDVDGEVSERGPEFRLQCEMEVDG